MNRKSTWLPLALPLLLVGCGADKTPVNPEPVVTVTPLETETVQVPDADDPIEQVDVLNETLMGAIDDISMPDDELAVLGETTLTENAQLGLYGDFNYDVDYQTPKGETPLNVAFRVEDGIIQSVTLTGDRAHNTSVQYQKTVETELGELVVGKNYLEVEALPSKVGGSSLTPTAFNRALSQLQAESA